MSASVLIPLYTLTRGTSTTKGLHLLKMIIATAWRGCPSLELISKEYNYSHWLCHCQVFPSLRGRRPPPLVHSVPSKIVTVIHPVTKSQCSKSPLDCHLRLDGMQSCKVDATSAISPALPHSKVGRSLHTFQGLRALPCMLHAWLASTRNKARWVLSNPNL